MGGWYGLKKGLRGRFGVYLPPLLEALGKAELTHSGNTDPDALRMARRNIFSATTRRRSADWDEYDRIAEADKRVAMILRPDHVYGTALARMREALKK